MCFSSDSSDFGGHDRVALLSEHFAEDRPWHERPFSFMVLF